MKRLYRRSIPLLLALIASLLVEIGTPGAMASHQPAATRAVVKLAHSKLGTIIVNAKGLTLYYYTPDKAGQPTCTGVCAQAWPPALKPSSAKFGHLNVPGKFSTVANPAGGRQITYNGWPLYTYSGDRKAGQTTGQGAFGVWFVATPALKRAGALSKPAPAPTATCTPSYYGC